MLALLSPSKEYNLDPGSYSGLPPPPHHDGTFPNFHREKKPAFSSLSSIRVDLYLPTLLGDFSS